MHEQGSEVQYVQAGEVHLRSPDTEHGIYLATCDPYPCMGKGKHVHAICDGVDEKAMYRLLCGPTEIISKTI
jgi:hypothetical protein